MIILVMAEFNVSVFDVLTPEEIYSITLFSQMEMLQSGYVGVGEFHYLHNQIGGTKYDNIAELSEKV